MNDDDAEITDDADGRLSDGTELADVMADMPVEIRASGGNDWRLGYVVWVEKVSTFPRVWVEVNGHVCPHHLNYVRKYRGGVKV